MTLTLLLAGCGSSDHSDADYLNKELIENIKTLENKPEDCFALGQVARIYQAKQNFQLATDYFEKLMKVCPDDFDSKYQYGVTVLLAGDKEKGLMQMREAIDNIKKGGDTEYASALEQDYVLWKKLQLH